MSIIKRIIVILIGAFIFTACQPTPEAQVVADKGEEYIESMLGSTQEETDYNAAGSKLDFEAPEKLGYYLEGEVEGIRTMVKVEADIIMPDKVLPVLTVKPIDIPYSVIDGLLSELQNGRLLYDGDICAPVAFKNDVQGSIDSYEWELSLVDEDNEDSKAFYKEKLKELYIELEKAPTTIEEANRMLASGEIVSKVASGKGSVNPEEAEIEYRTEIKPFELTEDNFDDKQYKITLGICTDEISTLHFKTKYNSDFIQEVEYRTSGDTIIRVQDDPEAMEGFGFTVEQAQELAEPIVAVFGSDFVLTDIAEAIGRTSYADDDYFPYGYNLIYTKSYGSVAANYAVASNQNIDRLEMERVRYSKEYPQEYLSIIVGEDKVISIEYTSPSEVIKTESVSAQLLPFEEIKKAFDRYIILTCNNYDTYINIYEIKLGLMRIAKPDSEEFLMIPVWDFYGYSIGATGIEKYSDEEYWDMIYRNPNHSFLTINAIDGSVIDRELGY